MTPMHRVWLLLVLLKLVSLVNSKNRIKCSDNGHVPGRWMPHKVATKSFHCCSQEDADYMHDIKVCGNHTHDALMFSGSNDYPTLHSRGCSLDAHNNERYTVSRREKYKWVPDNCEMFPFDSVQFCEVLGKKRMVFCGDSSVGQSGETLISLVYAGGGKCVDQLYVVKSYALHYARNGTKTMDDCLDFARPDIVIVGAGAHMHSLDEMKEVYRGITSSMPRYRKDYPTTTFVWKTVNAGHAHCTRYKAPVDKWVIKKDPYPFFRLYPTYDRLAKEFAAQNGWKVLDMSLLHTRPDAHQEILAQSHKNHQKMTDCLHYSLPGPLDVIGSLLLGMLVNKEI